MAPLRHGVRTPFMASHAANTISLIAMKPRLTLLGVVSLVPLAGFTVLTLFALMAYVRGGHWPRQDSVKPDLVIHIMSPVTFGLVLLFAVATGIIIGFHGRTRVGWRRWHDWALSAGSVLFLGQLLSLGAWIWR
jgi:hypothetical protein